MQVQEYKNVYVSDEGIFSFQDTLLEDISFKVFVECSTDKFIQYQKDILEEFVADFTSTLKNSEELDSSDIKEIFEQSLQLLNTKLKNFAEKVRDIERFELKWIIQLVIDDLLLSSMIGDISMLIIRDQKVLYSMGNSIDLRTKVDLCSNMIEWRLERDDQILYVGLKFDNVMDNHDIKEMETLISEENSEEWIVAFLEDLLQSRISKDGIGFIISYYIQWPAIKLSKTSSKWWLKLKWISWMWKKYISSLWDTISESDLLKNLVSILKTNKTYVIWIFLVLLITCFFSLLLSQIIENSNSNMQFQTSNWIYEHISLDDLQKEINDFKSLDASSEQKIVLYNNISSKLSFLEEQWRREEDVDNLKQQLNDSYYEWFRVSQFKTLDELNKIAWRNTQVISFNQSEKDKLWIPMFISVPKNIMIGWSKWAIINASSDTSRWTVISPTLSKDLEWCTTSLNSNWLYCYNTDWDIYLISKNWTMPMSTSDGDFRTWIWWLGTYGSRNLYVFQSNVSSLWNMLLTRYQTNSDWTYANFWWGTSYAVDASWVNFWTFSSFSIDGNFYGVAEWNLYLFRREDNAGSSLNYRKLEIIWWNPLTQNPSNNVKIVTNSDTRYIYTYDRESQLFTVYNTESNKMNAENKKTYRLKYLFSLKFDIEWVDVYDVDIPASTKDNPELYVLSSEWVNNIKLYEMIQALSKN